MYLAYYDQASSKSREIRIRDRGPELGVRRAEVRDRGTEENGEKLS